MAAGISRQTAPANVVLPRLGSGKLSDGESPLLYTPLSVFYKVLFIIIFFVCVWGKKSVVFWSIINSICSFLLNQVD